LVSGTGGHIVRNEYYVHGYAHNNEIKIIFTVVSAYQNEERVLWLCWAGGVGVGLMISVIPQPGKDRILGGRSR